MSTAVFRRVLVAAPAAVIASCLAVGSAAAATNSYAFVGSAYGSTAQVGSIARSGQTSLVSACNTGGYERNDHAAAVHLGLAGSVGAVSTKITGASSHGTPTETSTSTTGSTRLLGGLVQAKTITTRTAASRDSSGYHLPGSTTIADLRINGRRITATPKPNQQVVIPGVATVALNVHTTSDSDNLHQSAVTGIKITLLKGNRLGLPTGTIVVGHAVAGLHSPVHARPYGSAFATKANLGTVLTSGASAPVYLPCGGTSGKTRVNSTAAAHIGTAVSVGAISSSATSTDTTTTTTATTQAKAAHLNLLGGLITADSVTAKANAKLTKGKLSRTSTGTSVTRLKIHGESVSVSAKPNTKISLAGVGTVWLNRTIVSGSAIQVYAIQIQLSTARAGLKSGAVIDIAGARAGVTTN